MTVLPLSDSLGAGGAGLRSLCFGGQVASAGALGWGLGWEVALGRWGTSRLQFLFYLPSL